MASHARMFANRGLNQADLKQSRKGHPAMGAVNHIKKCLAASRVQREVFGIVILYLGRYSG